MKALAIKPRIPNSAHLIEWPKPIPKSGEVLVRMLEVGLCGTDAEINSGLYGDPPPGEAVLVLGHEGLGELENGQLVVPMVRRSCQRCPNCLADSQDMCSSGEFTERGIKGLHGMIREYLAEDPHYLIPISPEARGYAVLAEPMSIVAKGLRHTFFIQKRHQWRPKRALVLGAGPIGLLVTFTLRTLGWDVVTMARRASPSAKAQIVTQVGAQYRSSAQTAISDFAENKEFFDFIFEATGNAEAAFDSMSALAINGVLCLTSITGGQAMKAVPVDKINYDFVLGNKLVFGTVNANRQDFTEGLAYLKRIEEHFPGILRKLFTGRVSFENAVRMFEFQKDGIKTVFSVAGASP